MQRTDILFVIDDSGSMREEQEGIATELPAFVSELQRGGGVVQDFRVAVINTSVYLLLEGEQQERTRYPSGEAYPAGQLRPVPLPDGSPGPERFIEGGDPQLVEKFARLVNQGTNGSGQETPFEALRLALTPPLSDTAVEQGGTRGFLRDGARLLVVVVTDEEDCSSTARPPPVAVSTNTASDVCVEQSERLTSVEEYERIFRGLRDGRGASRQVLWAAIAPVARADKRAEPVVENGQVRNVDCPNSFGPGLRHREMALRFDATAANLDSICRPNYRQSLIDIASLAIQSLDVMSVPSPELLQVHLTRQDGTVQVCTVAGGGVRYQAAAGENSARVFFQPGCQRRADDQRVDIRLLCAG